MLETIRHLTGTCGEGHVSIWYILPYIATGIYLIKHNVKWCWNKGCDVCLKQFNKIQNKS